MQAAARPSRPKIRNVQALRGVAVLLVVAAHLCIVEGRFAGDGMLPQSGEIGFVGVDLFFVISGFVMVTVTRGRFGRWRQVGRFLYHRATRIYPLYWVVSTAVLCALLVRPEWINASQGGQVDIFRSFALLPQPGLPLLAVGWTLIH